MINLKEKKPNIVLIVMDAVRAQNISCYGYDKKTTPMLEKILPSSLLYKNAISSSYWTLPSYASMFTGTYLSNHGLEIDGDVLGSNFVTLAEFLKLDGYLTVGLCGSPYVSGFSGLDKGFDRFYGFESVTGRVQKIYDAFRKLKREIYSKKRKENNTDLLPNEKNILDKLELSKIYKRIFWAFTAYFDKSAMKINNIVTRLINEIKKKPFFLFVHYDETHSPYHPIKPYRENFLINEMRNRKPWNVNQDHLKFFLNEVEMDESDFHILEALYNGAINYLDYKIYEIYSLLFEENLLDNTMLILTSDHGDNIGEHNMMSHLWCLYDTLIKVPLIIKYPEDYNLYGEEDRLVQNVDLMPTIMDMLNAKDKKLLSQVQGNSLLSENIKHRSYKYAISELVKPFGPRIRKYKFFFKKYDRGLICIRSRGKKYVWATNGRHEFYDLKRDPNERKNMINSGDPFIYELKEKLEPWLNNFSHTYRKIREKIYGDEYFELDKKIEERLKKLGYF